MQKKRSEALGFIAHHPGFFRYDVAYEDSRICGPHSGTSTRRIWTLSSTTPAMVFLTVVATVLMLVGLLQSAPEVLVKTAISVSDCAGSLFR